jgi:hypothetical protein
MKHYAMKAYGGVDVYFSTSEFSFPYLLHAALSVMHISGMAVK